MKMLKKRWVIVVLLLLFVGGLVFAGGGKEAEKTSTEEEGIGGEITLWFFEYEINSEEDMNYIISEYEKKNPNAIINTETPPTDQYRDRLITAVGAGEAPDLATVATAWMTELADSGVIVDWESVMPSSFIGTFIQNMLETGKFNDKLYGLPYLATSRGMFINTEMYGKAGVQPAETWDEFMDVAQKTTNPPDYYGLALQGAGVENFAAWFLYFLWSYGGQVFDSQGNLVINSDAGVKALTYMGNLVNKWKVTQPNVTATTLADQLNLFKTGKAASTITGPWLIGIMATDAPNIDYTVVPIPKGTHSATLGVTDSLVHFKDSENQELALDFTKHFFTPPMHTRWVSGRGMIPVIKESAKDTVFTENEKLKVFLDMLPDAKFAPMDPRWTRIMEEGGKALQAVYLGEMGPKEALDKAVENVNRMTK